MARRWFLGLFCTCHCLGLGEDWSPGPAEVAWMGGWTDADIEKDPHLIQQPLPPDTTWSCSEACNIPGPLRCDGIRQCLHGMDEWSCQLPGWWKCWSTFISVHRTARFTKPGAAGFPDPSFGSLRDGVWVGSFSVSDILCTSREAFAPISYEPGVTFERCCNLSQAALPPVRCYQRDLRTQIPGTQCANLNDLGEWFGSQVKRGQGADKTFGYHNLLHDYERILSAYPPRSNFLEIGVAYANSLAMWGTWFYHGLVMGVDIDLGPARGNWPLLRSFGANRSRNIRVVEADIRQAANLDIGGPFDIILDDGDHSAESQIAAFELLFPGILNAGGTYVVEDAESEDVRKHFQGLLHHVTLDWANLDTMSGSDGVRAIEARSSSTDWRDQIMEIAFLRTVVVVRKHSFRDK